MDFDKFVEVYMKFWCVEDAEETPFKSKYEARRLAEEQLKTETAGMNKFVLLKLIGKNFHFTEQPAEAEMRFMAALDMWKSLDVDTRSGNYAELVDLLLFVSMMMMQRGKYQEALAFTVFARHACSAEVEFGDQKVVCDFHLAKCFGALGWKETSAYFCGRTLSGQWERHKRETARADDPFLVSEFVSHLSELAVFFVNQANFWTAEYLLHGALAAADINSKTQQPPSNGAELIASCHRDLSRFYRSRMEFARHVSAAGENEAVTTWQEITSCAIAPMAIPQELTLPCDISDAIMPLSISVDTVTCQKVVEVETMVTDCEGAEFSASATIGFPLSAGSRGRLIVKPAIVLPEEVHEQAVARLLKINVPIVDKFSKSHFPSLSTCGSRDILSHRDIFKLGLQFANDALNFFQLDGWATDHLSVVQELSHLWRELAAAEQVAGESTKRTVSMLERRYALLDKTVFQISPQVFTDFYKSFLYELGDICCQLHELKNADEDTGHNAVRYYELFVDAYGTTVPQPELRVVITAKLSAARLLMRLRGDKLQDQVDYNRKALDLCRKVLEMTRNDPELSKAPESTLAKEISNLLPAKLAKLGAALNK